MINTEYSWTDATRHSIKQLADILIPEGAGLPKASDTMNLIDAIDRILAIRPDLMHPVKTYVENYPNAANPDLNEVICFMGNQFEGISELISGAYFIDQRVLDSFNYLDLPTIPLDDEEVRVQLLREYVEPVVRRGSVWRLTAY